MNVRIEDNAVRFRISPQELARLNDEGRLESAVQLYTEDGGALEGEFIYALAVEREFGATRCHIEPSFILFILHPGDLALLMNAMAGHCARDSTSVERQTEDFTRNLQQPLVGLRIGLPNEYFAAGLDPVVTCASGFGADKFQPSQPNSVSA